MKEITTHNGERYCSVEVRDGQLLFYLKNGIVVRLDAKVIPQLRQILTEAEFFKTI